ncbi:hypothetical protein SAMN02927937_02257 [Paenimyroides aquimaris]|uniref:Uncharacterized protein n=1 Tax=Paenimyroides marinum TaxID=1159016 RepID=A0A1H6LYI2_9FLAO|nr:hypothetical protein [Paenimyroides aquimaris]SEH93900.1 hypothetical protein SAMN02927937_02257 [Paenimyroides aquimaris]
MKNVHFKKIILLLLIVVGQQVVAQNKKVKSVSHDALTKAGTYTEYISRAGVIVQVGDSLQINNPSNFERYMYITQNDAYLRADEMNKKLKVKAINVSGDDKKGYTVFFTCKGLGATPVFVRYEDAVQTNEIKLLDQDNTNLQE